ncbi:MAG: hypothetical protein ABJD11_17960 [Gemmatimonadota bacterium]
MSLRSSLPALLLFSLLASPLYAQEESRYFDTGRKCKETRERNVSTINGDLYTPQAVVELPVFGSGWRMPVMPSSLPSEPRQYATMSFVVDTTGRVDKCSIEIYEETSSLWTWTVAQALIPFRYVPGKADGQPVAMRVQQTFSFGLEPDMHAISPRDHPRP